MDYFHYIDGHLHAEQTPLRDIAARVGTPCYVYSRATLERHWRAFDDALGNHPHRICYSVKANGNLAVLEVLARLGSGFDIVSGGELRRVIAAGTEAADKTIFSGVGKQRWEIREALEAGIRCFNIESEGELRRISDIAGQQGRVAAISVRLNPDVDANTHPYISTGLRENKFGLAAERALAVYRHAQSDPNIRISGVACHIGSQLTDLAPYKDALRRVLEFVDRLEASGIEIEHIDFGGGLGVRYCAETPPSPAEYGAAILEQVRARKKILPVVIEPGRAIAANAGVLLTRVVCLKRGGGGGADGGGADFCVVDAGMNDLIRPALYQAHQEIVEVEQQPSAPERLYDVVGPVCESSDFLGKARRLKVHEAQPGAESEASLLAVRTAGAYGAVMSSNYNARPRPAEVMVDGGEFHLVRKRESLDALYRDESVLPD